MIKRLSATLLAIGLVAFGGINSAHGSVIFSATAAAVNKGGVAPGGGFGNIADTFNQNGLLGTPYVSDVTDFDSYVASTQHTALWSGNEWFSGFVLNLPVIVTYDFGAVRTFDALALWNEEGSGILNLDLEISNDGISFSSLAAGLMPADSPNARDYGAEVFNSFGTASAQFVRFLMTGPQPPAWFDGVGIGEVAFRHADPPTGVVPEPTSFATWGLLVGAVAAVRRRRK
ncbi:MAG: coagulation factor 5/8 type domain-containing protein [Planctomycetota bacterium]|nr:coagulation factor 5/8 type domain-containing protein [Planctomycetota bacterium]